MNAKRNWLIAGVIVGALLTLAPVLGLFGSVVGMMQAFSAFASAGPGISDPHTVSASISTTLISLFAGLALSLVGIPMLVLSLIFLIRLRPSSPPPLQRPPSQ